MWAEDFFSTMSKDYYKERGEKHIYINYSVMYAWVLPLDTDLII